MFWRVMMPSCLGSNCLNMKIQAPHYFKTSGTTCSMTHTTWLLSLFVGHTLSFEKFPVWQSCWCLAMVRWSFCLFFHLQLNKTLRKTAWKFLMYELFISCLGKHHEGVMISCMNCWAIMPHHMELFTGGWTPFVVGGRCKRCCLQWCACSHDRWEMWSMLVLCLRKTAA